MEIIKRHYILALLLVLVSFQLEAQTPTTWQSTFYKSYDLEKASNYPAAIAELKKVYRPDDYFVNIRLGWLYYLAKSNQESLKYYQIAIRLKPTAVEAKFGCVKPLSAMEMWDAVKDQYLSILRIDPNNTRASYWLGVIYYNRKEYPMASKLFEKIVSLYPLDYDSVIMLAWTKYRQGKNPEAKTLFNHALTLIPNDKDAISGLKLVQ
jgi:tetratricopeptide (TPR) repeat protein